MNCSDVTPSRALGHHDTVVVLARVVDVSREFPPVHFDLSEHEANMFALALLIPGFAVETLIMRRNMTNPWHMKDVFGVTLEAVELRLEKLGVVPCKYEHEREAPIRRIQAELRNYQAEVERYVKWATTLPRPDHM